MTFKWREVGLFCAALVLVLDAVPLLAWALTILRWCLLLFGQSSDSWLYNAFRTVALTFGSGAVLVLGLCLFVLVRAALAVSSGKSQGVSAGILASALVAALSSFLLVQGVFVSPELWLACAVGNTATAAYLLFFRTRMNREEEASVSAPSTAEFTRPSENGGEL